jgi:hypothetical protein
MKDYKLICDKDCVHLVRVIVHDTVRAYRRAIKEKGNKTQDSVACCFQLEYPNADNVVAEVHFTKKDFTPEIVAHECFHAACYRAALVGEIPESDSWEEFIAEGIQMLTKAILEEGAA